MIIHHLLNSVVMCFLPRLQAVVLLHDPPLVLLVIEAHQDRGELLPGVGAEVLQLRHGLAVLLFAQGDL